MSYTVDQFLLIEMAMGVVGSAGAIPSLTPEEEQLLDDIRGLLAGVVDIPLEERLQVIKSALEDIGGVT